MSDTKNFLGRETSSILDRSGLSDVEIVHDWMQLGGETYATDFLAHNSKGHDMHLVAKECVKYFPIETVNEWMTKRQLLQNAGVLVPELLIRNKTLIIEEFIPFTFREAYTLANEEHRKMLKSFFIETYKRVAGAGFWPISLHDARSRGEDVVLIDMGEDIGTPKPIDSCNLSVGKYAVDAFYRISQTEPNSYE